MHDGKLCTHDGILCMHNGILCMHNGILCMHDGKLCMHDGKLCKLCMHDGMLDPKNAIDMLEMLCTLNMTQFTPLGGIPTNLYLSVSTETVPSWWRGFLS